MNRTYSNKTFDMKTSSKNFKEKTPQLKKVISGPKKLYVSNHFNILLSKFLIIIPKSVEYVVKDSFPVEKNSENCLTQICEAHPNGRDHEILSPLNSKMEAHEKNYLTDQAHYYSFDEAENDHNNKDHLLNQIKKAEISKFSILFEEFCLVAICCHCNKLQQIQFIYNFRAQNIYLCLFLNCGFFSFNGHLYIII